MEKQGGKPHTSEPAVCRHSCPDIVANVGYLHSLDVRRIMVRFYSARERQVAEVPELDHTP